MKNTAQLSNCRQYRYALWRTWDEQKPRVMFIGLNPSTADETLDDPTLKRCMQFARDWGYGGVCIANLFAFRATQPEDMKRAKDPIGPDTDQWLQRLAEECQIIIAAWGNDGRFLQRSQQVRLLLSDLHYLRMNKSGEPAHSLYLPASLQPQPFAD